MSTTTRDDVFAVVQAKILDVLGEIAPAKIQPATSLKDLGANSLDRAEIVSLSMQALALRFPVRELSKVSNIGELVDALYRKKTLP